MADAIAGTPQLLRKGYEEAIDDRRFAEAIYRVALARQLDRSRWVTRTRLPNLGDFGASIALQHHATAFVSVGSFAADAVGGCVTSGPE